eukprot:COSAG02_NODE_7752_length_2862_cov_2.473037_4_plen_145_part_00
MVAPNSPAFDDPDELGPGERWSSDPVLGKGHHATAELQLAFLQLWRMFQTKELILRPRDKKRVPEGNVAKVAIGHVPAVRGGGGGGGGGTGTAPWSIQMARSRMRPTTSMASRSSHSTGPGTSRAPPPAEGEYFIECVYENVDL